MLTYYFKCNIINTWKGGTRLNKIKAKREKAKYSQAEAARILGISRYTLIKYENGQIKSPGTEILSKLALLYKCDIKDLI